MPTLADAGAVDAVVIATLRTPCRRTLLLLPSSDAEAPSSTPRDSLRLVGWIFRVSWSQPRGPCPSSGRMATHGQRSARAPLWGDAVTLPKSPGGVALISDSGNIGVVGMAHREGEGLHTVISSGNAAVVDTPTLLEQVARLDGVRAVRCTSKATAMASAGAGRWPSAPSGMCVSSCSRRAAVRASRGRSSPHGCARRRPGSLRLAHCRGWRRDGAPTT